MTEFEIYVQPEAELDIERALDWLYENHPDEVRRWPERIGAAIDSLRAFPSRCARWKGTEMRSLVVARHRLVFTIQGRRVRVLRVIHIARCVDELN